MLFDQSLSFLKATSYRKSHIPDVTSQVEKMAQHAEWKRWFWLKVLWGIVTNKPPHLMVNQH